MKNLLNYVEELNHIKVILNDSHIGNIRRVDNGFQYISLSGKEISPVFEESSGKVKTWLSRQKFDNGKLIEKPSKKQQNASRIYYKLLGSKNFGSIPNVKKLAMAEIKRMHTDKEYSNRINFIKGCPSLLMAFNWRKSVGGFKFWKTVFTTL